MPVMYQTLIQMPSVQWCLIFKDNSTVLPIHVGRWRFTGPPGTHSGYHGRCWGVEPVRLFQSPGFYPLHFQMSYSNDNNYKIIGDLFSFFDMTAFSRFPTPHSFTVKNTYFIYFLIRATARCSLLPFSTHDCWTAVAPSLLHTTVPTQKLLDGLWEAAMFVTALAHQGPSAFLSGPSMPTQRQLHRVFCLSAFWKASIPGPNNCYHLGPASLG